jgi:hypothetical protein
MTSGKTTALTRVEPPSLPTAGTSRHGGWRLGEQDILLRDRDEVRKQLPDILGQALARIWIDPHFHQAFANDPVGTLAMSGVFLPETMAIEFEVSSGQRPKVIVYEQKPGTRFRLRVFYLQLIMIAGR